MPLPPVALAALLLPSLAAAPAAFAPADFASLHVEPFEGPLTPEVEEAAVRVRVLVPCAGAEAADGTGARFSLREVPPAWLVATLSPAEVRAPAGPCPLSGERALESTLRVRVTADAPAFRTHVLRLAALVEDGEGHARELLADAPVQADQVLRIAVRATPDTLPAGRGAILTFPVEVTNLGNHHARALVSVVDNAGNLNVMVPAPPLVESRQAGGATNATLVRLQVQVGDLPERGATVRLRVEPVSPFDPRLRGEPQEVTLHVEHAQDNLAPGAGLHGAVLALAAGALVARRAARPRP